MKNVIVIYHRADFDGIFCREIAKHFLGQRADYLGWDYGDEMPVIEPTVHTIYMLDISVQGMMEDPRLTWIDHHKSAIDKFPPSTLGLRIDGVAACRLTWQWFKDPIAAQTKISKEDYIDRVVKEPYAVRLAGEYDVWDKRDPRAELFQHGLRSRDLKPVWSLLLGANPKMSDLSENMAESELKDLIDENGQVLPPIVFRLHEAGKILQYAKRESNAAVIKKSGFTVRFEGLCFLACNASPGFNSFLFEAGIKAEHEGLLGFNYTGHSWRISLYGVPGKPDVDLSRIAVKYGGGGHKQACGFEVQSDNPGFLPFPGLS